MPNGAWAGAVWCVYVIHTTPLRTIRATLRCGLGAVLERSNAKIVSSRYRVEERSIHSFDDLGRMGIAEVGIAFDHGQGLMTQYF